MRTLQRTVLTVALMTFVLQSNYAQDLYHVHEDVVKPSMDKEYNSIAVEIMAVMKENPVENLFDIAFQGDNGSYYFLNGISSMADLDKKSGVQLLAEKAGEDKVYGLFKKLDNCYDTELDYVMRLERELSYMPTGINQTPEGENYRSQHKLYISPGNRAMVKEKMMAIKNLMQAKGSKMYYRVYKSSFGTDEWYMVAIAAVDAEDYAKKSKANQTLIGMEGKKAFDELYSTLLDYEVITGSIRTDMMPNSTN